MIATVGLLIYACFFCLIIICLIRLARYLSIAGEEMKLTRIEIGKLAEEAHLFRKKFEDDNKDNLSKDPG